MRAHEDHAPAAVREERGTRRRRRAWLGAASLAVALLAALLPAGIATAAPLPPPPPLPAGAPDLGPNVYVFDPSMPTSEIQATVDAIAAQQVPNQFGTQRYALLFEPGTYGTADQPLNVQVGYYTEVAGLGQGPGDVTINGSVYVRNQCDSSGSCTALTNFWRSLSNLTINVTTPGFGCYSGEFWAVSQASPMRRVQVNGHTTFMDYCTGPSFASGGFIADTSFGTDVPTNGSQQQFYVRDSVMGGWSNGVWNQVFSGDVGAPDQCFPATATCGPYTTLDTTPVSKEKPYLYVDGSGTWQVFVPAARQNSRGATWEDGAAAGRSIPLSRFYVAKPGDSVARIDTALALGKNLLLTPGVYDISHSIVVSRPDTVVLGLGMATLTAQQGAVPLVIADVPGVDVAGLTIDAGPVNSPALLLVGTPLANVLPHPRATSDPTALQDVFFRIGGPHVGKATTSLVVNTPGSVLDDIWAWRADHGNGVGWTVNTADTGLVVNGDDVTATGLFVEHYQKYEVIWNGDGGKTVFFQNELPYDPPSQGAWRHGRVPGWAAYKVGDRVRSHEGWGMGSYIFMNQHKDIHEAHSFEVPTTPGVHMHDLLTVFLDATNGDGTIEHVVNDTGGSASSANPDVPVVVVSYP